MSTKLRKITFGFDERDAVSREELERRGVRFREVVVRGPGGEERTLLLPTAWPRPRTCFPR